MLLLAIWICSILIRQSFSLRRLYKFALGLLHRPISKIGNRCIYRLLSVLFTAFIFVIINQVSMVEWNRFSFLVVVDYLAGASCLIDIRRLLWSWYELLVAHNSLSITILWFHKILRSPTLVCICHSVPFVLEVLALWVGLRVSFLMELLLGMIDVEMIWPGVVLMMILG